METRLATVILVLAATAPAAAQSGFISYSAPASRESAPAPAPVRNVRVTLPTGFDQLLSDGAFGETCRTVFLSAARELSTIEGPSALDVVFGIPDDLLDFINDAFRPTSCTSECHSLLEARSGSMVGRAFDGSDYQPLARPYREFISVIAAREVRYFSRLADTEAIPFEYTLGLMEIDDEVVLEQQRRMLLDVAKKVYISRGFGRLEDRVRDDGFNAAGWRAIDYVAVPPLLAGYLYLRGIERRFHAGPFECTFAVEPIRRILERSSSNTTEDLVSAVGLEVGLPGMPIKLLVSGGLHNGDPELDFIGIGTGLGKAKQAVQRELELRD